MAIVAAILRLWLFIPYVPSRNLKNSLVAFCVRLKNFHLHTTAYGKRESFPSLQSVCWYVSTSYVSVQIVQKLQKDVCRERIKTCAIQRTPSSLFLPDNGMKRIHLHYHPSQEVITQARNNSNGKNDIESTCSLYGK